MARDDEKDTLVKLINVRLSFEHLFKKSASAKDGPLKYRASFIIDPKSKDGKRNIAAMEDAIEEVKAEHWKGKDPRFKADRFPLMDGNDSLDRNGDVRVGYEGMIYVKGSNDKKPKLRDRDGKTEVEEDDDKLYSGAMVTAYLRLYAVKDQDKGGNGIFASIEGVQFMAHGEKFGNAGMDDDAFENFGDSDDDRKPSRGRGRGIDDDEEARPSRGVRRDDDRPARRDRDDDDRPSRASRDDDI